MNHPADAPISDSLPRPSSDSLTVEMIAATTTAGSGEKAGEIDLRNPVAEELPPMPAVESGLKVDAIVLDIDDTLYLERDYVRSGFTAIDRWARHELGIEGFGAQAWAKFEAGTRDTIFDDVLVACGRRPDDAVVTQLVARYRTHAPDITLEPDAHEALERWTQGNISLAAITDGPQTSQEAKARALDLGRWVAPLIYTSKLGTGMGKPHPAAFELVQESLGVDGKRCVYIADNPAKDFGGPKSLGWRTVRVRRAGSLHVGVESGDDVDFEICTLAEVDQVLSRA